MRKKTHEEYTMELSAKRPIIEVVGRYIDNKTKIDHRCLLHNVIWKISPDNALRGRGCPQCGKEKYANSRTKTHKQYQDELCGINVNIVPIEQYIDARTPILHECKIDGYIWPLRPDSALQGCGCPKCAGLLRKTHNQYEDELLNVNPNIRVVEEYINNKTPILHHCLIHNTFWRMRPQDGLRGHGCESCRIAKMVGSKKLTHAEYVQMLSIKNPTVEVVGKYVNARTPILHHCLVHDAFWEMMPTNALKGQGCENCRNERIGDKNRSTHSEYVQKLAQKNPDIEVAGVYVDSETPILHRCKIDGHEWYARPYNILSGKGCPQCQESKGERLVRQWLDARQIVYTYQKYFDDCYDKRSLPFDFYLTENNICIEYQGQQHYEPVDFSGEGEICAIEKFMVVQYHDQIKADYCAKNNIKLVCIPYWENVAEYLNKILLI